MRNNIDPTQLRAFLEERYPLKVTRLTSAPRGFVAETFRIETTAKQSYFAKLVKIGAYSQNIEGSLPVLDELYRAGIENITIPVMTADGEFSTTLNDHLCVLFRFIDGQWRFEFDFDRFTLLLAAVHKQTPKVRSPLKRDDFSLLTGDDYQRRFQQLTTQRFSDPVERQLQEVIMNRKAVLESQWSEFVAITEMCRKADFPLVITHGDAPGNCMVTDSGDVYIVDWDDILLAPVERDTWFFLGPDRRDSFVSIYRRIFPDYEPNWLAARFNVYRRYFEDIEGCVAELFNSASPEGKQKWLNNLHETFQWLEPLLEGTGSAKWKATSNECFLLKRQVLRLTNTVHRKLAAQSEFR